MTTEKSIALMQDATELSRWFMPYQIDWILDETRLVLWEKSIRIGATFAQAYRAVRNRMRGKGNYLHTSVTAQIGKSFALDCKRFCEIFDLAASEINEFSMVNPITDRQESAFEIYFEATKCFIKIYSSNPDALRGDGGEVGIDELSSHAHPDEMLKAAGGRAMWGDPIRIWTSHRGSESAFARMIQEERAKGPKSRWKICSTDLYQAIDQGLLAKINQVKGTTFTREEFIADTVALVGGQEAFEEECLLKPRKGGAAAIKWQFIEASREPYSCLRFEIEGDKVAAVEDAARTIVEALQGVGRTSLGYDVARKGHLSAVWINRREGEREKLSGLVLMHNVKFGIQRKLIQLIMRGLPGSIGGGDSTGLGMQVCEELTEEFGQARFTGLNFSALKPEMGTNLVRVFEDARQIIPAGTENDDVAYDIAAIRTEPLPSGRTRFYESQNPIEKRSHCDMVWAGAIANFVAKEDKQPQMYV